MCFVMLYFYRLHCQFQWFGLSWQIFSSYLLRIQDICCKLPVNSNWITLDNPALGDKPQLWYNCLIRFGIKVWVHKASCLYLSCVVFPPYPLHMNGSFSLYSVLRESISTPFHLLIQYGFSCRHCIFCLGLAVGIAYSFGVLLYSRFDVLYCWR